MALIAKKTGSDYPPIEGGTYQAVCYSVVDLGTQFNEHFNKSLHKVIITWEIPELRIEIEKDNKKQDLPRAISKIYTLSLHEKSNLCKDLVAWRGKSFTTEELEGFDVLTILGANCLLQIIQEERGGTTYANVAGVSKLMKNMPKVKSESDAVTYEMKTDGWDIPEKVPDWIQQMIKKSIEYKTFHDEEKPPDNEEAEQVGYPPVGSGEPNPDFDPDYVPPKDEVPF